MILDGESKGIGDNVPDITEDVHVSPPPPQLDMDQESNNDPTTSTPSVIERLTDRFIAVENQLADVGQRLNTNVSFDEFEN